VGARQSTSGTGTQAVVQVDLWRGLKLQGIAGTSSGTTETTTGATDTGGSSIGLTYQFEY
jgi:translocation and assembly module TamB